MSPPLSIAFVHPDLGIGGAERLVVDAAIGLQRRGHAVTIFTSHHSPAHCFPETADGTLEVVVHGDLLPRTTFGKMYIVWALIRNLWLSLSLVALVVFYCHFPDQLLTKRESLAKRIYRAPFDWLEKVTTGCADVVLVNSNFTRQVFDSTFGTFKVPLRVVYPGVDVSAYDALTLAPSQLQFLPKHTKLFLSINRFERKKNIEMLVHAFAQYRQSQRTALLVVAGGYDHRVAENVEYLTQLQRTCDQLGLCQLTLFNKDRQRDFQEHDDVDVLFLPSISEEIKVQLLQRATVLLYSPANEHFGIVPVEAMYNRVPVIAVDSGGPRETVSHNKTGLLCSDKPEETTHAFTQALRKIDDIGPTARQSMGYAGRQRVQEHFTQKVFIDNLESVMRSVLPPPQDHPEL
ncbi:Alpha-1,3-mannosyltransferase-like protein [Sorochytrium milnesiophthora]